MTSVTILAELGDPRRFQNSRDAVRYAGLDITVHQSDQHRSPGHLSRQGPPALRWALYEAAQAARRPSSPDRHVLPAAAERIGGNRACIAIARKLLKRSYHLLRELGDQALEPVALSTRPVTRQARQSPMNRGQLPPPCCRPLAGNGPERLSGRTTICRNTHHIMYPTGSHPGRGPK